ncbi:FAD-dependent oxidoreductase [Paracoccus liaowanqingii]|uniref:FAD-dependent oxidoreductase n=1 Tax=Paracoccus liaowanqingii TaxID=2560053 RepID=A0A4P7HJ64_9RHOB|nr:FAD-dependent oxidoreductase [Paracoccus liaowanqingii]QBX34168.1 FAD-dependent oxidoreductase [Paracoccus liaowanqingii]
MTGALEGRPATVIGAGIGGLTAALALARRGARVTLLERAPTIAEVGAGIQLSANAVRVFDALGLGPAVDAASLRNRAVQLNDAQGRRVLRMDLAAHRPEARFLLIHRARLIDLLARAALDAGVDLRLGQDIATPPDLPLVIGADGVRSTLRRALNGPETPFFTGQTAWRALLPEAADAPPEAQVFMGPGRHLVSYPLAGGLRNLVAVVERADWQDEGWSHPGDPTDLRAAFAGFAGPVPGWLAAVDRVHLWGLFRHPVAARWHDDRRAILGDAAHPTLPFLAQGAGMAIEDAWVLAACLDAGSDQPAALARYQALRQPRVTRITDAATANARNYHFKGPMRLAAHTVLRLADRLAPGLMPGRFDWLYDHDPVSATP